MMIDDTTTTTMIRNLLASPKPAGMTPLDVCQIVQFMLSKSEDHNVYFSQNTLARMFGTDARTIARSQDRLEQFGWIARPRRTPGKTHGVSLRFENIPAEETLRLKVTDEAKQLAQRYKVATVKMGKQNRPKHWLQQQFVSAQRILDACNGNVNK